MLSRFCEGLKSYFVSLSMNGPILSLISQLLRPSLQDDRMRAFRIEKETNSAKKCRHDESDPCSPAPTKVLLSDEAAHNRASNGSDESSSRKDTYRICSIHRSEEVNKRPSDNGERCAGKSAAKDRHIMIV